MFSKRETAYVHTQRLARFATGAADGQCDNDAVGFTFDGASFSIICINLRSTRKYRNIVAGNTKVLLIVDDLEGVDPWRPREIKVHGIAELGERVNREAFWITPIVTWSWGIDAHSIREGRPRPNKRIWASQEDEPGWSFGQRTTQSAASS